MEIKKRLKNLELKKDGKLSREERERLEDAKIEELARKVKGQYPGETELLEAIDNCRRLEPLDTKESIEEYRENLRFITLEIRRLQAEAKPTTQQ